MGSRSTATHSRRLRRGALAGLALALLVVLLGAALAAADSTPSGVLTVTTLAGTAGSAGSADGSGSAARFYNPAGLACDAAGNLYVADDHNNTIRKVTPAGVVTTLAGLAGSSGASDGSGSAARFNHPYGVACDPAGNVYVADNANHTIRKVTAAGAVTTLAGLAGVAGSADGSGNAARFYNPTGVACDAAGNVYVADEYNQTIRKVTPAGVVATLAGSLAGSTGSADGSGSAAQFAYPVGVACDAAGNVYVADKANLTIRKITPSGAVTTLAGLAGVAGSADGSGSAARFYLPVGVACDAAGNVYVADDNNQTIRKVTPAGVVTTLAGLAGVAGSADGSGSAARFLYPTGVACDAAGNVYVADEYNRTIRKGVPAPAIGGFSPASGPFGTVVTIAGSGFMGATAVSINGTAASNFTVNSAAQITATVPSGATSGSIVVTTPVGVATSAGSFTVTTPTPAKPVLAKLAPVAAKRGASVTITGSGFGAKRGASVVKFGKKACGRYLAWGATRIKVRVPAKAAFGKVKVTVRTAGGTSNSRSFRVKR